MLMRMLSNLLLKLGLVYEDRGFWELHPESNFFSDKLAPHQRMIEVRWSIPRAAGHYFVHSTFRQTAQQIERANTVCDGLNRHALLPILPDRHRDTIRYPPASYGRKWFWQSKTRRQEFLLLSPPTQYNCRCRLEPIAFDLGDQSHSIDCIKYATESITKLSDQNKRHDKR